MFLQRPRGDNCFHIAAPSLFFFHTWWWLFNYHVYCCSCYCVEFTITQEFVYNQNSGPRSVRFLLHPKLPEFRRPPCHPHPRNKCHLVRGQCFRFGARWLTVCHNKDIYSKKHDSNSLKYFFLIIYFLILGRVLMMSYFAWLTKDDFQNSFKMSLGSTLTTIFPKRILACPNVPSR